MSAPALGQAKKPVLRTPAQLKQDLAGYERQLADAQRLQGSTKAALSNHLGTGDPEAVRTSRAELAQIGARIQDLTETIEALRGAIVRVESGEQRTKNNKAFAVIARKLTSTRDVIKAHADALNVCGRGYAQSLEGFDAAVRVCMENGVAPPDPYSLQAKFTALCDQALYVSSDGRLGSPRGLDSIDQMRQAPSLADQAAQWCEVNLRRIRLALGIPDDRGDN
jgi:hypothetical protein